MYEWLLPTALAVALVVAIVYLLRTGRLACALAGMPKQQDYGLEFLKLPEDLGEEEEVESVELIHFKGKYGLEVLIPPWLDEVKESKEKSLKIKPVVTLLTGGNLTGYLLMLTKMLFLLEKVPVFLVAKERDIDRFKRHSNISISIFRQESQMSEEIKMLKYQFHKGIIDEEEFKKKILKIGLQAVKSQLKEPLYDGYKYLSNPREILADLQNFLSKTKEKGIVVVTIVDEMLNKSPKKGRAFLGDIVKICSHHSAPLILASEQGVFPENISNVMKSYSDMVLETTVHKDNRYVTVYSFERVFPKARVSEALKHYKKFLKKVGFWG